MTEATDFENELANFLGTSGNNSESPAQNIGQSSAILPPSPPAERSKEKILSQSEIDALLASMNLS